MIHFDLLRDRGILIVTPQGPLEKTDFDLVAQEVDPYIAEKGKLNGLMIYAKSFPGWKNFEGLLSQPEIRRRAPAIHRARGRCDR